MYFIYYYYISVQTKLNLHNLASVEVRKQLYSTTEVNKAVSSVRFLGLHDYVNTGHVKS